MTATNHALTGAAIGIFIADPAVAMAAAFISHFVLDAIPHYGMADKSSMRSKGFKLYLCSEAFLCFLIVLTLFIARPTHWWVAAICAFLAASPDFYWIRNYKAALAGKHISQDRFSKFASRIQWFERPIGAYVEIAWFIALIVLLVPVFKLLAKT